MTSTSLPRHGSRSRYSQGCHCDRCRAANANYVRDRRRARGTDQTSKWAPAEPVRLYVRELLQAGMSIASVAEAAGVKGRVVRRLMSPRGDGGMVGRVSTTTASRIRAVLVPSPTLALVDVTPRGLLDDADLPLHEVWRRHRACRGVDTNVFFPDDDESAGPAVAICGGCTVRLACLSYALTYRIDDGVWGGLTETQRRRHRKEPTADPPPLAG